jgi:hypothetical protein
MSATSGTVDPPWLGRLRELDPRAAEGFDLDPKGTTHLDTVLAHVNNTETKVAIIRSALERGMAPNDPAFIFNIQTLGIAKLISADFEETVRSVRIAAQSASEAVEDIQAATKAAVAGIQDASDAAIERINQANTANEKHIQEIVGEIKKTTVTAIKAIEMQGTEMQTRFASQVDAIQTIGKTTHDAIEALPKAVRAVTASVKSTAKESVETITKGIAEKRIDEITEAGLKEISAGLGRLKDVTNEANKIHDQLVPLRAAAARLVHDEKIVAFGRSSSRREVNIAGGAAVAGAIFGMLLMSYLINVLHLGLDQNLVVDAAAGRTYQAVWAGVTDACRTQIRDVVIGQPPSSRR